jgi:YVTN family beta-propeller protein
VTNFADNNVSVIDLPDRPGVDLYKALLMVNNTIPVGINPRGLAVDRDSRHAYVVNVADETLSVIDTANGAVMGTAYVGHSPDEVAVAPDGTAYVTDREDGSVTVIHPSFDPLPGRPGHRDMPGPLPFDLPIWR